MAGFSINLKGANLAKKNSTSTKRKKRGNLFGDSESDQPQTSKIRLTHVDEYQVPTTEKLVIEPPKSHRAFQQSNNSTQEEPKDELRFGLNSSDKEAHDQKGVTSAEHRAPATLIGAIKSFPADTGQEEYEEVPIEEFGDALLRGMGWDGKIESANSLTGDRSSKKKPTLPHEQTRQPLAGLGAKVLKEQALENAGDPKPFLPIIKIKKRTGDDA